MEPVIRIQAKPLKPALPQECFSGRKDWIASIRPMVPSERKSS